MTISSSQRLEDIEAIRQLKHAYFRLLDSKHFDEIGELFTEDATSAYQSGELSQNGREEIVAFLRQSLESPKMVTMHTGHHPEIWFENESEAAGSWYLEDLVFLPEADFELHGTAIYSDRYVKIGGEWKIRHTGYERIFERQLQTSTGRTTSFKSRFDP